MRSGETGGRDEKRLNAIVQQMKREDFNADLAEMKLFKQQTEEMLQIQYKVTQRLIQENILQIAVLKVHPKATDTLSF